MSKAARAHRSARRLTGWLLAAALAGGACGEGQPPSPSPDAVAWCVPFTVRGRWEQPRRLSWSADPAGGPLEPELFAATIERALEVWTEPDRIGFRPAGEGETADVSFSWARAAHGTCPPFGMDFSVAHTSPVGPGCFVHFDAGHDWSVDGAHGESLRLVAAHEIGHVLGLDHSPDPDALMFADATGEAPTQADLAGLHSLYGGGEDGPGDLGLFVAQDGARRPPRVAPPLHRVAPVGRTEFALFDTDGDGREEVLVWRTEEAGLGALTAYHFASGPRLVATIGPLLGVVPAGAEPSFGTGSDGRRWVLACHPDGRRVFRWFDDRGLLTMPTPAEFDAMPAAGSGSAHPARGGDPAFPDAHGVALGDLDGDGSVERVVREVTPGR